jgi:L-ascorbate metabolism protein UlaG (beta-lactamase superfamily)
MTVPNPTRSRNSGPSNAEIRVATSGPVPWVGMRVTATHLGTATVLLTVGPFRLLTDPALDPPGPSYAVLGLARYRRIAPPVGPAELGPLDAVLLSHDQHGDNLDRSGLAVARTAGVIVTTRAGAARLGGRAVGLRPWQSHQLRAADGTVVTVTATPAHHGPSLLVPVAGPVIGFVVEWEGQSGGAVWISGDTVLYRGIRQVAERFSIGTAFVHMGRATLKPTGPAHFTLTATEAAETARLLGSADIYPIHYEGWSHFREGRADVEREFIRAGLRDRLRWLPMGETVEVRPR